MSVGLNCGATGKAACAVDASKLMYHMAIVSRTLGFFCSSTTLQNTWPEPLQWQPSQCLLCPFDMESADPAITAIAVATSYVDLHILVDPTEVSDQ